MGGGKRQGAVGLATVLVLAIVGFAGWEARSNLREGLAVLGPPMIGAKETETLDDVMRHIGRLPDGEPAPIAAMVTEIGHWRLANRTGEIMTAAGRSELTKALRTLIPETEGKPVSPHIHLAPDSLFRHANLIEELPVNARLSVVIDGRGLQVRPSREGGVSRYHVLAAKGLLVEASDGSLFKEVAWQLQRQLKRSAIRVLALEPSANPVHGRAAQAEPGTRRGQPRAVDPGQAGRMLQGLGGDVALLTGRLSDDGLLYKPGRGPEGRIGLADLWRAAEQADANLIVLATSSPRQPGSRNWLWQRMGLTNAERALEAPSLGALLHALAGEPADITVKGRRVGESRIEIDVTMGSGTGRASGAIAEALKGTWSGIVSETAGSLRILGMRASLTHSIRQAELDRRLLPFIPSTVQFGYLALISGSLLVLPLLRAWWRRIWPEANASAQRNLMARWLARSARCAMFAGLFLPLAALPALLVRLAGWAGRPSAVGRGNQPLG